MPDSMKVKVRVFAALREILGVSETLLDLKPGTTVEGLIAHLTDAYPAAHLANRRLAIAVNHAYAPLDRQLAEGDEIALLPPVSGGSGRLFELTESVLSIDDVVRRIVSPELGGVTVFAGTVRGITSDFHTDHLEYEAYPEMAEQFLAQIGAEVQERWPEISAVSIVHRLGRLMVGDIAVVVAVASAHRRDTFAACQYAIDRIKEVAPIWKKEVGPDGNFWVEGPESQH